MKPTMPLMVKGSALQSQLDACLQHEPSVMGNHVMSLGTWIVMKSKGMAAMSAKPATVVSANIFLLAIQYPLHDKLDYGCSV